jgi:hypothetical protein
MSWLFAVIVVGSLVGFASAADLYVPTGYSTIQAAINAANPAGGDVIHVAAGLYSERVIVDRPVTLLGATAAVNKNGYAVPALYAWNTAVESVIDYPDPTGQPVDQVAVDIRADNVTFKGFIVQILNARVSSDHLLRLNAQIAGGAGTYLSNIVVENNVLGPVTNVALQNGTYGRMGLYFASPTYPANRQGIRDSHIAGNKIFDARGNGNTVFIWGAAEAYASLQNADYTGTVIEGNEIYGSHRSGIEIAGGVSNLTIRNNTIRNNSSTNGGPSDANLRYGNGLILIRMGSDKASATALGCDHLTIQGNQIYGNEKNGIYLGPINGDHSIISNIIRDNGWDGLRVDLTELYHGGTWPVYGRSSNIAAPLNSITGNGLLGAGVVGVPTNGFVLGATDDWWGSATGPGGVGPGSGDEVSGYVDYDPWIGKTGGENIVCDPDPEYLTAAAPTKTIAVRYLGGGSGPLFGYTLKFTWDGSKVSTAANKVTQGDLLYTVPFSTFFFASLTGTNEITVDCARLGNQPGVMGPGTMFTIEFTGTNVGTSPIDITPLLFRDNTNTPLSGFYADDGLLIVDVTAPSVTNVFIENVTLAHTDDYIKNTDAAKVTATVTDDDPAFGIGNITANLTGLGGGASVAPDTYVGGVATWQTMLGSVTTNPANGTVTVTVTATDPIGNTSNGNDTIIADNIAPTAVMAFDAAPAHEECVLSWTNGTDTYLAGVTVRRLGNGEYPTYPLFVAGWPGGLGGYYPATPAAGTEAYNGAGSSATDAVVPRDIYYYQAFCYDVARNYGPAASTARDLSTNYWLGDVAAGVGVWGYNGLVNDADINFLGGEYHQAPSGAPWNQCDVGPTVHEDYSRVGLPKPDNFIGFEDLMIFAMNYGVVAPRIVPFLPGTADEALALSLAEVSREGDEVKVALRLSGNAGEVKGFSASVEFDAAQLEFVSAALTSDMQSPLARVFFWAGCEDSAVKVDLAVLGTDVTIGGSGDAAVLTFRVLSGDYALEFADATLRGADNEALAADLNGCVSHPEVPTAFRLVQNAPNPFNPRTTVAYDVPVSSEMSIRVYDVTGRLVTTLVDGVVEPGRHAVTWNGTNDAGEGVGTGVYFCVMDATDYHATRKMTLLR